MRKTITKLNVEIFIGSKKNKKLVEYDKNKSIRVFYVFIMIFFIKEEKTKVALENFA